MTTTTSRPTPAQRLGWAALGATATLAGTAALAVHWARAIDRTERYGTHQIQHPRR